MDHIRISAWHEPKEPKPAVETVLYEGAPPKKNGSIELRPELERLIIIQFIVDRGVTFEVNFDEDYGMVPGTASDWHVADISEMWYGIRYNHFINPAKTVLLSSWHINEWGRFFTGFKEMPRWMEIIDNAQGQKAAKTVAKIVLKEE